MLLQDATGRFLVSPTTRPRSLVSRARKPSRTSFLADHPASFDPSFFMRIRGRKGVSRPARNRPPVSDRLFSRRSFGAMSSNRGRDTVLHGDTAMRFIKAVAIVLVASAFPEGRAQVVGSDAGTSDRRDCSRASERSRRAGSPGSLAVFAPTASAVVAGKSDGGSDVAVVAAGRPRSRPRRGVRARWLLRNGTIQGRGYRQAAHECRAMGRGGQTEAARRADRWARAATAHRATGRDGGADDTRGEFPGVRCPGPDPFSRHAGTGRAGRDRSSSPAAVCWRRRPAGAGSN